MNFRDRWVTDEDGEKFLFTVEMQRSLSEAGLPVEPESLDSLDDSAARSSSNARSSSSTSQQKSQSRNDEGFEEPATIQIDPQTGKYIGRMKWYNSKKGYGFIIRGGGEEIFFHKSGMDGDPNMLKEGQWILYDVEETRKGPEATEIEPYEGETDLIS